MARRSNRLPPPPSPLPLSPALPLSQYSSPRPALPLSQYSSPRPQQPELQYGPTEMPLPGSQSFAPTQALYTDSVYSATSYPGSTYSDYHDPTYLDSLQDSTYPESDSYPDPSQLPASVAPNAIAPTTKPVLLAPSQSAWERRSFIATLSAATMAKRTVGTTVKSNWNADEYEAILAYLSQEGRYTKMKVSTGDTFWDEMGKECFFGTRTGTAIKTAWNRLKATFVEAQNRIKTTGEGERDDETWMGYRGTWLGKLCPYFAEIGDILQKDKTFTPPMVSDVGGVCQVSVAVPEKDDKDDEPFPNWPGTDPEEDVAAVHPPQGGKKDPRAGNKTGKRKREAKLPLDDIPSQIVQGREERRLERAADREREEARHAREEARREREEARHERERREDLAFRREELERKEAERERDRAHQLAVEEKKTRQLELQLQLAQLNASGKL